MEDRSNYENSRKIINEIVVELLKNILTIEERSLRNRGIKNLSMTEIHTIEAIGKSYTKTMSEIAESLNITMGTLTTSINRLENKEYVCRSKDVNDRRVVLVNLTNKGELVDKIHKNFHEEMINHAMIDLKLDEDRDLIKALKNINEFFLKEYGGKNVY